MTTGQKIRRAIKDYGQTQKSIAKNIGISESTLSQWITGKIIPPMPSLQKFAIHIGKELSELLDDDYINNLQSENTNNSNDSEYVTFPVLGEIAAGFDKIIAEDWDGEKIPVHTSHLKGRSKDEFFVLEVKGNSMYPEYQNGDKVLILKQSDVSYSGQVGAVLYDDDLGTLKKVEYPVSREWVRLVAINPNVEPKMIEGEELAHCRIIGIPTLLIRDIK